MKWTIRKFVAVSVLAVIVGAVFALPALAASKYAIGGTCNANGTWYLSEIDRKVPSSKTSIRASFHNLCAKSMYFRLIDAKTGKQLGSTIVASGDVQTLATGVKAGTLFNNSFKLSAAVLPWQDRKFSGYQWY